MTAERLPDSSADLMGAGIDSKDALGTVPDGRAKVASDLTVDVVDIQGSCPVYRTGDRFVLREGYKLQAAQPVCMHGLQSICPYYVPLSRGIDPADLGLAGPDGAAYVQCLDPRAFTGGGTVTFRISALQPNTHAG